MVKENIFQKDRKLATMYKLLCPEQEEIGFHNSTEDIKATWNVAVALYKMQKIPKVTISAANYSFVEYGQGRKYLFVTVKRQDTGEFINIYYDFWKHMWTSKEADLTGLDISGLEKQLDAYAEGGFTRIRDKRQILSIPS